MPHRLDRYEIRMMRDNLLRDTVIAREVDTMYANLLTEFPTLNEKITKAEDRLRSYKFNYRSGTKSIPTKGIRNYNVIRCIVCGSLVRNPNFMLCRACSNKKRKNRIELIDLNNAPISVLTAIAPDTESDSMGVDN